MTHLRCDKQYLALHTIIWLEGDWNYTCIYQQDQPVRISACTLRWYERQLMGFRGGGSTPAQAGNGQTQFFDSLGITLLSAERKQYKN